MRKAKLILGGVGLFAVIGGAFAFKTYQSQFVFVPQEGAPANTTICTVQKFRLTTLQPTTTTWATTNPLLPCTTLNVRQGD